MSLRFSFFPLCLVSLLVDYASTAAIDQQVILPPISNPELTGTFPVPYAAPCYHIPGPFDLEKCEIAKANNRTDRWISDHPGGHFYGNWASCQSRGETCALSISTNINPSKDMTCHQGSVSERILKISPSRIKEDIKGVLRAAASDNKPLVVRNTGHDWKGRSSGAGAYTIWTHELRFPNVPIELERNFRPNGSCDKTKDNCNEVEPEMVFHLGAGETWGNAHTFANNNSLALVGGTCPTVGIAGWLQGGGHSPLTPKFGIGVDNVRQVELISAAGELVVANEYINPDLFFAIRGGGAGTFGVVTKLIYRALPIFTVQELVAEGLTRNETEVKEFISIVTSNAPKWGQNGWGGYIKPGDYVQLSLPDSTYDQAKKDMSPLTDWLKKNNYPYTLKTYQTWYEFVKEKLAPTQFHPPQRNGAVASRLVPPELFKDSRSALGGTLFDIWKYNIHMLLMLVAPTSYNHTTESALHPSWKTAIMSVRVSDLWDQYTQPSAIQNWQHFNASYTAMKPLTDLTPGGGASITEAHIWQEDHSGTFWGADNYAKLMRVKEKWDPKNLLTNWMAVNWTASDK